jgi:hypothetical protein
MAVAVQDLGATFFSPQSIAQAPLSQESQERKKAIDEAWKAYRGKFPKPLKVAKDQPDDNVLSNRCAPIVEKGVSFLFGQPLQMECADQDFMDGLWGDDDDKMTKLSKIDMNGGVSGQAFLKIIPVQGSMKYPRIVNLNSRNLDIITDPEDCDLHLAYIIEYPRKGDMQKRQVIARVDIGIDLEITGDYDLQDTWTITNYMRKGQTGQWFQVGTPEEWLYPFAPIFTCQNLPNPNEAWGIPDLTEDLIQMNKSLNFVLSSFARILKYHGHPKTWVKGVNASQIQLGIDDVIVLGSVDAEIGMLELTSNLQSFLAFLADLRADMDEQSRVPAVALGRETALPKGQISGVALQMLFQPLIEKTQQKQRLYGKLIREVSRAALVLAGKIDVSQYEDYDIDLQWQSMLPVDDLASAQEALLLKQLGISDSTIFGKLGFDAEEEAEKSADEDAKKMDMYSKGQGMPPANPMMQQQPGQPPAQQPGQPGNSPFLGRDK